MDEHSHSFHDSLRSSVFDEIEHSQHFLTPFGEDVVQNATGKSITPHVHMTLI